jgi:ABC-type branched-subunit amino acid transport system substrate-binding protein
MEERKSSRMVRSFKAGIAAVVLVTVAACSSSAKPAATTPATTNAAGATTGSSAKAVTFALITDVTGVSAPRYRSTTNAMEAAIAEANAAGGVNGYQIKFKVYDSQSSQAGGLQAVRTAISDKVFAVVAVGASIGGGLALLSAAGIPEIGSGSTPAETNRPGVFSISGNLITQNTTAWPQVLLKEGRTRIAVVGGTLNPQAAYVWKDMVGFAGGSNCFFRVGVDSSNTATLTALAHEILDAKCQGVLTQLATPPGALALQQSLNQLGGDVPVVDPVDSGPAVTNQYGSSVNQLISAEFYASPYATGDKGVNEYLAAMKQYEPTSQTDCFCEKGYAEMRWALHALGQLHGQPTQASYIQALNSTQGYDVDGLVPPIEFPQFHTQGSLCLSYSVIRNGQWVSLYNGSNPYLCGKRFAPAPTTTTTK